MYKFYLYLCVFFLASSLILFWGILFLYLDFVEFLIAFLPTHFVIFFIAAGAEKARINGELE